MTAYLRHNGWHFSKELCEFAVRKMRDRSGGRLEQWSKEQVQQMCANNGIMLDVDWDAVYLANMAKSDFFGSSIVDERQLCQWVADCMNDPDAPDGVTMVRWYATMCRAGVRVPWEDVL